MSFFEYPRLLLQSLPEWRKPPGTPHPPPREAPTSFTSISAPSFLAHQLTPRKLSGPTAPGTALSEARSYANLAAANNYWSLLPAPSQPPSSPHPLSPLALHPRILCEERALDSHQNILFSLVHFWRCVDPPHTRWPARLTIVSHAFKRRRLVGAHCAAVGWWGLGNHQSPGEDQEEEVVFVGINPPGVPEVLAAEERAVEAWGRDPQGRGEALRGKRRGRNPWGVAQTLFLGNEERARSGVATELLEDGREEVLVEGGWRPWGRREERTFEPTS